MKSSNQEDIKKEFAAKNFVEAKFVIRPKFGAKPIFRPKESPGQLWGQVRPMGRIQVLEYAYPSQQGIVLQSNFRSNYQVCQVLLNRLLQFQKTSDWFINICLIFRSGWLGWGRGRERWQKSFNFSVKQIQVQTPFSLENGSRLDKNFTFLNQSIIQCTSIWFDKKKDQ